MLHTLAATTTIVELPALGAADLDRITLFLTGRPDAAVVVVKDPRPFPELDVALAEFGRNRRFMILDRIVPNPRSSDIMAMVAEAEPFAPDLVVGVGGGSSLDSAKAVSAVLANGGDLDEYLGPSATRRLERRGPKLACVPTTTGTGAEVTKFGVYTNRSGKKFTLNSPLLQADAALLVASLVADIPAPLLAATAYDAVTHALETLWNRNATPLSDALAHDALADLLRLFPIAYEARSAGKPGPTRELLSAACAAGVAFNHTGTAVIHALSFVLSEAWHVPHGAACAFFTDDALSINAADPAARTKLADVSRRLYDAKLSDAQAVDELARRLVSLREATGLPSRFSDLGVDVDSLQDDRLKALFQSTLDDPKMKNNSVPLTMERVLDIVRGKRR